MEKSGLHAHLNNCESLSKKLKLEASSTDQSYSDTVKCTDVLNCLKISGEDDGENCRHTRAVSPQFPPRRRLRSVLQNKSNLPDEDAKLPKEKAVAKKAAAKEKSTPSTVQELIAKVPCVKKYFNVKKVIGWGTFSTVFVGSENQNDVEGPEQICALKHVCSSSTNTKQVMFEIKCLKEIGGHDHVIGLKSILRSGPEHVLVMPYYKQDRFSMLIQEMTVDEVREYMRCLLKALSRVHKFNVIHRDVKPSNFLYERRRKRAALVDFGLAHVADYYKPSKKSTSSRPVLRERTKSASLPEISKGTPIRQIKRLVMSARQPSPLHTRSSSMVAMAKTLQGLPRGSRKRSADVDPAQMKRDISKQGLSGKRPCLFNTATQESRFIGTPRPQVSARPVLLPMRIPTYVPMPSTPSPVGNSAGSDFVFTSTSPASPASPCLSMRRCGRTIADILPNMSHSRSRTQSNAMISGNNHQARENVSRNESCSKCKSAKRTAPRAGTAGFRAPEVLIHCPHQTTAVDVWSAGVMFLSLLTGRYPFFKPANDTESLVQMIAVFGTEKIKKLARTCGKRLTSPFFCSGYKLETVVETFRNTSTKQKPEVPHPPTTAEGKQSPVQSCASNNGSNFSKNKSSSTSPTQLFTPPYKVEEIPPSAYDLLKSLLEVDPLTRISAKEALEHPFFTEKDA